MTEPDPLAEFRRPDPPRVSSRRHPDEWPAVLELNEDVGVGAMVTNPEALPDGIPPDGKPGADDILRVFTFWGLDPEQWEIVDGTITVNVWPMTVEAGEVRLFRQYKAKLRKKQIAADIGNILKGVAQMRPRRRRAPATGRTRVMPIADPQMGKAGQGGAEAIAERWMGAVQQVLDDEARGRRLGYGTDTLIIPLMGDLIEGCSSGHESQLYESDLTFTEQLELVRSCIWHTIKAMAPEWETVHVAAVPGNHGEIRGRKGGGLITTPSDNMDLHIPDTVRRSIGELAPDGVFDHVSWWMPRGETMHVVIPSSPVLGMIHGHQAKRGGRTPLDKAETWFKDQLFGDTDSDMDAVDVLLVGHWHHFDVRRSGSRTLILCPSLENPGGSQWFRNQAGANCPPGVVTFLLDGDHSWGVRNIEVH